MAAAPGQQTLWQHCICPPSAAAVCVNVSTCCAATLLCCCCCRCCWVLVQVDDGAESLGAALAAYHAHLGPLLLHSRPCQRPHHAAQGCVGCCRQQHIPIPRGAGSAGAAGQQPRRMQGGTHAPRAVPSMVSPLLEDGPAEACLGWTACESCLTPHRHACHAWRPRGLLAGGAGPWVHAAIGATPAAAIAATPHTCVGINDRPGGG